MLTSTDYDKLEQLMEKSPENEALIKKLLSSHKEMIRSISHVIRNPLTLVYSTLQLIESQHPEVASFRHWDSLRSDVAYMKVLLEELSSFNSGETLSFQKFDFYKFAQQLTLSFAASCVDSGIYADPVRLREVFLNLLRNAKEAIDTKGFISFRAVRHDKNIFVTISDSGCGIPAEYFADLFTPFVTHKEGGTGLGLSISKRIIKSHNGTISVESTVGKGTTFTLTLPL